MTTENESQTVSSFRDISLRNMCDACRDFIKDYSELCFLPKYKFHLNFVISHKIIRSIFFLRNIVTLLSY